MRRKIYNDLLEWKNTSNGKTALLIDGARRVGKSYIVKEFAEQNYKQHLIIDFSNTTEEIKDLFNKYLDDLDTFFNFLSNITNVAFIERDTVIIFDEVQFFPRARAAIKHLVADGRYDYIETGSLISIRENVQDILIPSEERHLKMFPMDFEEFLWAMGNDMLMDFIRDCFKNKQPLGPLHRKAMDYFKEYMIIGGMPQVVEAYSKKKDFMECDRLKRDILNLYRSDIRKHAGKYSLKVERIFDSIPSQLSQHEKKFKITSLEKDAKTRDYKDAFMWLDDAVIVNHAYNTTNPSIGLSLSIDDNTYKCYMGDTGLLISQTFDEKGLVSEEVYKKILFDKLSFNGGMIVENVVAQMLVATNHKLFFYSNYSKVDSQERMKVDFLIAKSKITSRKNISPIEVKSSKNYTLSSLNKFKNKYKNELETAYIVHTSDYKEENGIVYLPIYMVPLL